MPYLPEKRQYRNFAASNFQPVTEPLPEIGDDADEERVEEPTYKVRGHFTTFSNEYELFPGFYESIAPTALDECDMSDVIFQFDHSGPVLARQRNGSLRVGIDPDGGWAEADLSGCRQARDLYESIANGLVVEMSFGFTIDEDGMEWEEDDDGNIHSRITKIERLYDVSAVSIPANGATDISARSLCDGILDAKKAIEDKRAQEESDALERRMRLKRRARALSLIGSK